MADGLHRVHYNPSTAQLVEFALLRGEGELTANGALVAKLALAAVAHPAIVLSSKSPVQRPILNGALSTKLSNPVLLKVYGHGLRHILPIKNCLYLISKSVPIQNITNPYALLRNTLGTNCSPAIYLLFLKNLIVKTNQYGKLSMPQTLFAIPHVMALTQMQP